jgi:hypothetical protein
MYHLSVAGVCYEWRNEFVPEYTEHPHAGLFGEHFWDTSFSMTRLWISLMSGFLYVCLDTRELVDRR